MKALLLIFVAAASVACSAPTPAAPTPLDVFSDRILAETTCAELSPEMLAAGPKLDVQLTVESGWSERFIEARMLKLDLNCSW